MFEYVVFHSTVAYMLQTVCDAVKQSCAAVVDMEGKAVLGQ